MSVDGDPGAAAFEAIMREILSRDTTTARVPGLDLVHATIEYAYARGWSDGLPVVPPSQERCAEFLATTGRPPDEVIGRLDQLQRDVTVEFAATNAIMAGCLPEHFPVVLAAWDALMLERAVVAGGWQITSGRAPLIVVNGPVRHRLGFGSTAGAFGPGFRANATVARAIGLIVLNGFGVRPPVFEQPTQGVAGPWAMCLAENEEESPWEPLSTDGALSPGTDGVSATLVRSFEYVDSRGTRDPQKLLDDIADELTTTDLPQFRHAAAGIILSPAHAQLLSEAGMAKRDVGRWLEQEGYSPEDLMIIVAGDRGSGTSAVVRLEASWSRITARVERQRITEAKEIRP